MSTKSMQIIFVVLFALASIWNCCCLVGLMPLSKWPFSLTLTSSAALIVLTPVLFPALTKADEKSRYYVEDKKGKKTVAGITICFCFVWFVTILACLVYPR